MDGNVQVNKNALVVLLECVKSLQEANTKMMKFNIQWHEIDKMKLENELTICKTKKIIGQLPEDVQRMIS